MKKFILAVVLLIFLFQVGSGNAYAQDSDLNKITCDEVWKIVGSENCERFVVSNYYGSVWCNLPDTRESLQPWIYGSAPSYRFEPGTCEVESEDEVQKELEASESQQSQSDQTGQSKSSQDVKPLDVKLFGVNPFQTWLNLRGLAEAFAYFNSQALIEDTEYAWLPGKRARVKKEVEWNEKMAEFRFIQEREGRFSELTQQEKIRAGEIIKKWDTRIEAKDQPVIIQQDSATLQLQPLNGQPGVMEPEPYWPMLKSGALDVIFEPQNGQQFQMQTPNTEIFVIGTEFSVIYNPKKEQTVVAVYKGEVEVKTKDGKITAVSLLGDEPGILVVSQKLSVFKLVFIGLVLVVIIAAVVFFVKKRLGSSKKNQKKK